MNAIEHDDTPLGEPESGPLCDSGMSDDCSQYATTTLDVPYLRTPLNLCRACKAYEVKRLEDGPGDDAWLEQFYGSSVPQTDAERLDRAAIQRRDLERRR